MRIGFDARCLEEENISGVGEYALELLENFLEADSKNEYIIFSNSFRKKNSKQFERLKKYPNATVKKFTFPNKLLNFFIWYFNLPKIDDLIGGADIFFAPNINFIAVSKKCGLVATFHDLSFERNPKFFGLKSRLWHKYFVCPRKIAKKSEILIAISESTKADLEEIYRTDSQKIKVVYHGLSNKFRVIDAHDQNFNKVRKKYGLPDNFILYLGNIETRKNIAGLISAYNKMSGTGGKKYEMVLVGKISPVCRDIIAGKNIFTCGYIDSEDRPYVYNLASIFVYPSFFEGFGLPIIESMACGTPVVTSSNSAISEVAGSAAILVDPNRPDEITQAMRSLLTDRKLYDKIKHRGLFRARSFSWKSCAQNTLSICESA